MFRVLIDAFVHRYMDKACAPTWWRAGRARFHLGSVVAYELNVGFVPIRKRTAALHHRGRDLRAGMAAPRWNTDAVKPGNRVLLIDDLIATGGP